MPLVLVYYAAKLLPLLLLRGIPWAIWLGLGLVWLGLGLALTLTTLTLTLTLTSSLWRGLGRLCTLLGLALVALARGVGRCCAAVRRCWREAIEAVVVPCKRYLFALHDALVLSVVQPLGACARALVVAPLTACFGACYEHCLAPVGRLGLG